MHDKLGAVPFFSFWMYLAELEVAHDDAILADVVDHGQPELSLVRSPPVWAGDMEVSSIHRLNAFDRALEQTRGESVIGILWHQGLLASIAAGDVQLEELDEGTQHAEQ